MKTLVSQILPSLRTLLVLTVLTGAIYPAVVTGAAWGLFAGKARGSLIAADGEAVAGSRLIGQPFDDPKNFWSRPSATAPAYNGGASSGSNYGTLNPAQTEAVTARIEALRAADPGNDAPIPADLITASASGLDPHISPAAAEYQVARVARARGLSDEAVRAEVREHTLGRSLGFLGEPRVAVLELNLALDAATPAAR